MSAASAPILCLVVDRALLEARGGDPRVVVAKACEAGADRIQLRERALEGADWLRWAEVMAAAAREGRSDVEIIVGRRVDVALCIGAGGVQLGFDAMAVADARQLLGADALIGVSTHASGEVEAARDAGADLAQLAPIWAPASKPATRPALGTAAICEAAKSGLPLLAQGGIRPDRCEAVMAAGAAGVCVTGDVLLARRPDHACATLRRALDRAAGVQP